MNPLAASTIKKDLGAVFTPDQTVDFLVSWAIRSGAAASAVSEQLYAVESYEEHFNQLVQAVQEQTGCALPHLCHAGLFETQLPQADAVVGNPPYVIRHRLDDARKIRATVSLHTGRHLQKQQADLHIYFVIYAASFLKEGGRLALAELSSFSTAPRNLLTRSPAR